MRGLAGVSLTSTNARDSSETPVDPQSGVRSFRARLRCGMAAHYFVGAGAVFIPEEAT